MLWTVAAWGWGGGPPSVYSNILSTSTRRAAAMPAVQAELDIPASCRCSCLAVCTAALQTQSAPRQTSQPGAVTRIC